MALVAGLNSNYTDYVSNGVVPSGTGTAVKRSERNNLVVEEPDYWREQWSVIFITNIKKNL
jgi:hypothetical protein